MSERGHEGSKGFSRPRRTEFVYRKRERQANAGRTQVQLTGCELSWLGYQARGSRRYKGR